MLWHKIKTKSNRALGKILERPKLVGFRCKKFTGNRMKYYLLVTLGEVIIVITYLEVPVRIRSH